jgi:hypothetical protein
MAVSFFSMCSSSRLSLLFDELNLVMMMLTVVVDNVSLDSILVEFDIMGSVVFSASVVVVVVVVVVLMVVSSSTSTTSKSVESTSDSIGII